MTEKKPYQEEGMKRIPYYRLSGAEKQCLRYMALLPPKPEPIWNLSEFFQLKKDFAENIADIFGSHTIIRTNWDKIKLSIRLTGLILQQLWVYERLNWEQNLQLTLDALQRKGWLEASEGHCYMLSLDLRDFVLRKVKRNFQKCLIPLDYLTKRLNFEEDEDVVRVMVIMPYADYVLDTIDLPEIILGKIASYMARIHAVNGNFKKAIYYQQRDVSITERIHPSGTLDLAFTYGLVAIYSYHDKNYVKAKNYIEKAMHIFRHKLPEDDDDFKNALAWENDIFEAYSEQQDNITQS
jgi:hypothetical protein